MLKASIVRLTAGFILYAFFVCV